MLWGQQHYQQQQQSRGSGGQDMSLMNGHYIVHNCNSAPSITSHNKTGFTGGVNSSLSISWIKLVSCSGYRLNPYFLIDKPLGNIHLEDQEVDEKHKLR
jgi:hypothetical protein